MNFKNNFLQKNPIAQANVLPEIEVEHKQSPGSRITVEPDYYKGDNKKTTTATGDKSVKIHGPSTEDYLNYFHTQYKNRAAMDSTKFKQSFEQKNPIAQCAKDQGGSGCVKEKPNGSWGVISNKTDKFWPQDYKDKKTAAAALRGYHSK